MARFSASGFLVHTPWGPRKFARYVNWAWLIEGGSQYFAGQTGLFRAAVNTRLRQGHRHRGGRRVAVVLNGDDDTIHRNAHAAGGAFDDADVGLMRHDPGDVVTRQPGLCKRGVRGFGKFFDGMAEDRIALHAQVA